MVLKADQAPLKNGVIRYSHRKCNIPKISKTILFFPIAQFTRMSNGRFAACKHSRERSTVGRDRRSKVNTNSSNYECFFFLIKLNGDFRMKYLNTRQNVAVDRRGAIISNELVDQPNP